MRQRDVSTGLRWLRIATVALVCRAVDRICIEAGRRRSGDGKRNDRCITRVVVGIDRSGELATKRSHVGDAECCVVAEILFKSEVDLVHLRVLHVGIEVGNSGTQ